MLHYIYTRSFISVITFMALALAAWGALPARVGGEALAVRKPCTVCCGYADFKAGFCAYFFGYIPKNYFLGGDKLSYNSAAVLCSSFFVRQKNIRVRKRTCYAIYKKYF